MRFFSLFFLSTLSLCIAGNALALTEQEQEQLQRLDDLDARIDDEASRNVIPPWRADELHQQVQTLRLEESSYPEQEVFDQRADSIEQQLDPPLD